MIRLPALSFIFVIVLFYACSPGRHYVPGKKFSREELQHDYSVMREILETKHPSLYWYTSPDSMDMYFDRYYGLISDSMTEQQFAWKILAPAIDKIQCGHTSLRSSKGYAAWSKNRRFPSFPLNLKFWKDSMAVTSNLDRSDSTLRKGTLIKSINGLSANQIRQIVFDHLPTDGRADNFNYIRLSSNFPYYHRNIFGIPDKYRVVYLDSNGIERIKELDVYRFRDSIPSRISKNEIKKTPDAVKIKRRDKLLRHRSLKTDSSGTYAVMTLNTFSKGNLYGFFRKSFRKLNRQHVNNLIIDLRVNGGGKIAAATLLTRYISREPFRMADTVVSITRTLGKYTRYASGRWLNNLGLKMMTGKKVNESYHIRHYEKKMYKPVRKNHFDGNVIILINGPTFSASTLFCNLVKGQKDITLLGEETGGGWHGNNGVIIPDITLPNSRIRFRLPLFRLVQYKHVPKDGKGISPDIFMGPDIKTIRKGNDFKMEKARELIQTYNQKK